MDRLEHPSRTTTTAECADVARRAATTLLPRPHLVSVGAGSAAPVPTTAGRPVAVGGPRHLGSASWVGRSWTSPFAASQPTFGGRMIRGLAAHDGKVYIGYGDSGANPGAVHIHHIDATTGQLSGSQLAMATEQNTRMKTIGGALHAANIDPRMSWEGGQPFASNRGGAWAMSGWTNCCQAFDIEAVPGLPGSVMAAGSYLDRRTGASSYATWLTLDEGATWKAFQGPNAAPEGVARRVYRLILVRGELYAFTAQGAWRWRHVVPEREWNSWDAGWEPVTMPGDCSILATDMIPCAGNGAFAVWSMGPTWSFDGFTVRRMTGHLDMGQAFCTDPTDGHVYGVTRRAGIVRSLDGVHWFRHPSSGVWGPTGVLASSIAVTNGTIFVGDHTSTVHAVASTSASWRRATTS